MFGCPFEVDETRTVGSFQELHEVIKDVRSPDGKTLFRGQAKSADEWSLLPKAYREPYRVSVPQNSNRYYTPYLPDKVFLEEWVKEVAGFFNPVPKDLWIQLAIAQHNGLPTRLLDWTKNPLAAAYFAVENREDRKEPSIYVYQFDDLLLTSETGPFRVGDAVNVLSAYQIDQKIVRQDGMFTIHPPTCPPNTESVLEVRIEDGYADELMSELRAYGITRASLFPGLESQTSDLDRRIKAGRFN